MGRCSCPYFSVFYKALWTSKTNFAAQVHLHLLIHGILQWYSICRGTILDFLVVECLSAVFVFTVLSVMPEEMERFTFPSTCSGCNTIIAILASYVSINSWYNVIAPIATLKIVKGSNADGLWLHGNQTLLQPISIISLGFLVSQNRYI